jgi:hypothetical protein
LTTTTTQKQRTDVQQRPNVTAAATSTIFVNKCNVGKYNIILSLLNIQWLGWDGNFSKKKRRETPRHVPFDERKRKKLPPTSIHFFGLWIHLIVATSIKSKYLYDFNRESKHQSCKL